MLLMTIRKKKIRAFALLTCFLSFYTGFSQQIMCFEFNDAGEIHTLHLQLIECNPISAHAISSSNNPGMLTPSMSATDSSGHGCTNCKDFHLSIKRNPGTDLTEIAPLISLLPFAHPVVPNRLMADTILQNKRSPGTAQPTDTESSKSISALRTTVLQI